LATEEGIVVSLPGKMARVRTQKTGACESCAAKSSCHVLGGGKEMEVDALNAVDARMGDRVLMGFETGSLIKASLLIYIFPIVCMIFGGFIGQETAPLFGLNAGALSVGTAFLFLGLAFVFVRIRGNRMGRKESYRPRILRILAKG